MIYIFNGESPSELLKKTETDGSLPSGTEQAEIRTRVTTVVLPTAASEGPVAKPR